VTGGRWGLAAGLVATLFLFGACAASDGANESMLEQRSGGPVEDDLPFAPTTELQRPPTTTTTQTTTTTATTTTPAPPPPPPPPPTTAAPTAQPECHPSYEGTCIPPDVYDADCAGGSGDGPWYVQEKNIRVVGSDVFRLDHDNNGIGCEA